MTRLALVVPDTLRRDAFDDHFDRLREAGLPEDQIATYDEWHTGVAIPPSYYGSETRSGFVEPDGPSGARSPPSSPESTLAELRADLDVRSVAQEQSVQEAVSGGLADPLESPGYV